MRNVSTRRSLNLQEITQRINAGEGSLGRLLKDDALAKSLTATTANLEEVTGRLQRNDNSLGKLLTEKELYDRFNSLAGARRLARQRTCRRRREHSANCCDNKELYENMNAAASEAAGAHRRYPQGPEEVPEREGQHFLSYGTQRVTLTRIAKE